MSKPSSLCESLSLPDLPSSIVELKNERLQLSMSSHRTSCPTLVYLVETFHRPPRQVRNLCCLYEVAVESFSRDCACDGRSGLSAEQVAGF